MKSFLIKYITLEDGVETVSVEAKNREDAKIQLKKDYWDVKEIVRIWDE